MNKILEVSSLAAGYKSKPILTNVNFKVDPGEIIGIIGPNGAGKTTLLKTIRGLLPIQNGIVKIDNIEVEKLSAREFSKKVAYLQQNVEITFGYTAKEIVTAGRYPYLKWWQQERPEDAEIVESCMQYTGIIQYQDTTMDKVSGGQKQRILLAKVLAQQTPLLFLDEPTTGLDIVYQEDIFSFCKTLAHAGKTILMVVHDLNLAYKYCSRLLLVANGGVVVDGTPDRVITEENLSQAYKVPLRLYKNPVTGGIEISTQITATTQHQKNSLLKKICCQVC